MISKKKEVLLTSDGQSAEALLDSARLAAKMAKEMNEKGGFDDCRWYIRAAQENLRWALKKIPYIGSVPDYKELCLESIDDKARAAADSCTEDDIEKYISSARASLDLLERGLLKAISHERNYALCDGFPGASAQVTWFGLKRDALKTGQERWDGLSDEDKRYAQAGVSLAVVDVMNNVVKDWTVEEQDRVFKEREDAIRAELRDKVAREEDGYVKVPAWRMHYPLPEERAYGVMEQDIGEPGTVLKLWPSDCAPMLDRMADSPLPEDADMVARVKAKQKDKGEPE